MNRIRPPHSRVRLQSRVEAGISPQPSGIQRLEHQYDAPLAWVLIDLGLFEYEEYISLKTTNDPNEGYVECATDAHVPS